MPLANINKMSLNTLSTQELEKELKRRKTKHNLTVDGTIFSLTLDELEEIRRQIDKINPPVNPLDKWLDIKKEYDEKTKPYISPPSFPSNPWQKPEKLPYEPPQFWCEVKDFGKTMLNEIVSELKSKK